ncbi:ABATE domain-containing protein [Herbidospora sp. RD11066]
MVPASTVLSFVNTRFDGKGGHVERFGDAADFAAWAAEHGFPTDETISESEAFAARELRTALLTLLLSHNDHPDVTEEEVRAAERHLAHAGELYPIRVVLTADGSQSAGQRRGAAGVFGSVLAAADQIVQQGRWPRMKACCSAPCRHGFLDRTRNGTQRYCAQRCASRAAMRAMRDRQNDGTGAPEQAERGRNLAAGNSP